MDHTEYLRRLPKIESRCHVDFIGQNGYPPEVMKALAFNGMTPPGATPTTGPSYARHGGGERRARRRADSPFAATRSTHHEHTRLARQHRSRVAPGVVRRRARPRGGAFGLRRSVETVAEAVGVSRFAIYNSLNAAEE